VTLITVLLAWGVLSFGAVYPWAYGPMIAVAMGAAVWVCRPRWPAGAVTWAFVLLTAAIAIQIIPLSAAALQHVSPHADRVLRTLDIAYAIGPQPSHPLSIDPGRTALAIGFLVVCAVWVMACASVLNRGASALVVLVRNVTIVATIVAVLGLAQKATFNGKLLWFWTPNFFATNGFGPFVNRNHFAGWMLLALALTIGLLFGLLARGAPAWGNGWRNRVLWLGSSDASPILLTAAAALTMACALLWTMSRSGMAATGVALALLLGTAVHRAGRGLLRPLLAGSLLFIVASTVAWRGPDTLVDWYSNTATLQWRMQLWEDTLPALKHFWLTGSGLNTFSTLMIVQPRTDLTTHPNAAHNDYLQLAIEGGLLVGVPALLLAVAIGRAIVRELRSEQDEMTWWIRMGAVAGMCGMAVQEISEFSLQIPGVSLLFATCLAVAVHRPAVKARRRTQPAHVTSQQQAAA
jgi:O-antigen ligase